MTDRLTGQAERIQPPTVDEWIQTLEDLLGHPQQERAGQDSEGRFRQADLVTDATWDELNEHEERQLGLSGAQSVARVLAIHPWLRVTQDIADHQAFFHWELEFSTVFSAGGFDLQLGNPPWVRPDYNAADLLAEGDPWWHLENNPSEAWKKTKREETLARGGISKLVLEAENEVIAQADFLAHSTTYSVIAGTRPDLYRCFMSHVWLAQSPNGVSALIHLDTHFADDSAVNLRGDTYRHLRRHWQFINELSLFEIQHQKVFAVNVYGAPSSCVSFYHAVSLYHPMTLERSLAHDGSGEVPGIKDQSGRWDLRAHRSRIQLVTDDTLKSWAAIVGSSNSDYRTAKMVYVVSSASASALAKIANAKRLGSLEPQFSGGWNETTDRQLGRFESSWGAPESWQDVILQGPHIFVGNPLFKTPNRSLRNHLDWTGVDLERAGEEFIPITGYKPKRDGEYNERYSVWHVFGNVVSAREFWRVAWRRRADNSGERTLIPAIIPPGAAHLSTIGSAGGFRSAHSLVTFFASLSSLLSDSIVRSLKRNDIIASTIERLPLTEKSNLDNELFVRCLRLNCLTSEYSDLWNELWGPGFSQVEWTNGYGFIESAQLGDVHAKWTPATPLRIAADRRQALVEIDALVALLLGITADELCAVYRTQFPVLYGYDRGIDRKTQYWYDQNGRLVPLGIRKAWLQAAAKGTDVGPSDLVATNTAGYEYSYAPPFTLLDREADMRAAYAEFERRLADQG